MHVFFFSKKIPARPPFRNRHFWGTPVRPGPSLHATYGRQGHREEGPQPPARAPGRRGVRAAAALPRSMAAAPWCPNLRSRLVHYIGVPLSRALVLWFCLRAPAWLLSRFWPKSLTAKDQTVASWILLLALVQDRGMIASAMRPKSEASFHATVGKFAVALEQKNIFWSNSRSVAHANQKKIGAWNFGNPRQAWASSGGSRMTHHPVVQCKSANWRKMWKHRFKAWESTCMMKLNPSCNLVLISAWVIGFTFVFCKFWHVSIHFKNLYHFSIYWIYWNCYCLWIVPVM